MQEWNDKVLIFEDRQLGATFRALYPGLKDRLYDWQELAYQWVDETPLSETEQESQFEELLDQSVNHRKKSYLFTLRKLRESMLLTAEDIDFCFSLMPETPKHNELKLLAHRYLESTLGNQDWTSVVWRIIEALRSGGFKLPEIQIAFVWGTERTHLFGELARTIQSTHPETGAKLIEPWELNGYAGKNTPRVWSRALLQHAPEHVANWVAKRLNDGVAHNQLLIPIHGSPALKALVKTNLAARGIAFQEIGAVIKQETVSWIEKVRADKSQPLSERLQLIHRLRENGVEEEPDEDTLDRFTQAGILSKEECLYLSHLEAPPLEEETVENAIVLAPFVPIYQTQYQFALVDDLLSQPERYPFCLEESEIDLLNLQGFPITRTRDIRSRQLDYFKQFLRPAPGHARLADATTREQPIRHRKVYLPAPPATQTVAPLEERVEIPKSTLSATQLETFAQCPAKYFFSNKLRLRTSRRRWEDRFALLFGTAAHAVLEDCLRENPQDIPDAESLRAQFIESVKKLEPTMSPAHPMWTILEHNFARISESFPEMEKDFRNRFGGEPTFFEKDFTLSIGAYQFRGKIDRIDKTSDGSWLVLDYKTGKVAFSPNQVESGQNFQALLYLLAAKEMGPTLGVLFYDLKKSEVKRGMLHGDIVEAEVKKSLVRGHALKEEKLETLLNVGQAHIKHLSECIFEGVYKPKPDAGHCSYCEYATLCRGAYGYG